MIFFLPLAVYTAIIVFLCIRIWKRTRQISFLLGTFFLYYWSLLGSWFLVYDDITGGKGEDFGLHHYVYFQRLFPVNMDFDYFLAITYYALFIIIVQLVVLYYANKKTKIEETNSDTGPVQINYWILLAGSSAAIVLSYLLVWDQIVLAAYTDKSIYTVTRFTENRFFSIHQLLNQAAIISLYLALVSYFSGSQAKYIKGGDNTKMYITLFIITLLIESAILLLGNKREILFGGIFGLVFYTMNTVKINYKKVAVILSFIVVPLFFNDSLRAYSPTFLTRWCEKPYLVEKPMVDAPYTTFSVKNATFSFLFSNEMFCSHFSMYGVVHKKVPFTYGKSFAYLAVSVIPGFIYNNRPEDVYTYYAREVGAEEGQGYTIHHATGWYLNFGLIGLILGALVFGWIWSRFYVSSIVREGQKGFLKIFFVIALPCFTAAIPSVVRSGPEVYKAVVFEYLLIPVVILFAAYYIKNKIQRSN